MTKKFGKSTLVSRYTTTGPERAPHRSYLYAMGLGEKQINQPLIGVATTWNEAAPCNITLARQAQVVKKGVAAAGWDTVGESNGREGICRQLECAAG